MPFGSGRELTIDIEQPSVIQQGAGITRLLFPMRLDHRNTMSPGVALSVSGHAWLGPSKMDYLGPWTTAEPVATHESVRSDATVVLPLSDDQLAAVEHIRAGSDLSFWIDTSIMLGYDPAVAAVDSPSECWPVRKAQDNVSVQREAWSRLLSQSAVGMSLAIVMPVPLDKSAAGRAGINLREAIRKLNNGEYADAVTEARKAMESIQDTDRSLKAARNALAIGKDNRSLEQRLSLLRYAVYGLASPAAHGDDNASTVEWGRETALAAIAGVAAALACGSA
jgi:hypothetical protein